MPTDSRRLARVPGGRVEALALADSDSAPSSSTAGDEEANSEEGDGGPWIVHGLALREDAVTTGLSGEATYWPADVLRAAVEALDGAKLIADHPTDDERSIRDIVGQVVATRYIDGLGLAFEAEIDDPAVARLVERERVAASPWLYRTLSDERREGARIVSAILGFRDLGVVVDGAGGDDVTIRAGSHPSPEFGAAALGARESDQRAAVADALAAAFFRSSSSPTSGSTTTVEDESENPSGPNYDTMTNNEHDELKAQLREARDERDDLLDENREMKRIFAEGLAEHSPFSAAAIADRFEFSEIREALESDGSDAETPESVLSGVVEPRSAGSNPGGTSPEPGSGTGSLSRDDEEALSALRERRRVLDGRAPDSHIETIDEEIEALSPGSSSTN